MKSPKRRIAQGQFPISSIRVADENAELYGGFSPANADDAGMIENVRAHGILTPLTLSADEYLLSGHRRRDAAVAAGLDAVPVHVDSRVVFGNLDRAERIRTLRAFNHTREKTFDEKVAEALVDTSVEDAYRAVLSYRARRAEVSGEINVFMGAAKRRADITTTAFLRAVQKIVEECRAEWPISNRAIHYLLLNDPPLTHDAKPNSHYQNAPEYAHKLSSLLTRARIAGLIPMQAICDEERPCTTWQIWPDASAFVAEQQKDFLRGYCRNLMQSQPHHVEVVVEKRTKYAAAKSVAANYTIPVTAGKGFASLPPRYQIAKRYRASRKDRLILIFLTDFDPDGEQIAASFARSMRDDFGIEGIHPVKAALNAEQVRTLNLPSSLEAKPTSPNFKKFVERHGGRAVELDAMPGDVLARELKRAIEGVLDVDAFNAEVEQEKQEQAEVAARRGAAIEAIGGGK